MSGSAEFTNPPVPALPPSLAPVAGALANAVNGVFKNGDIKISIEFPIPPTCRFSGRSTASGM